MTEQAQSQQADLMLRNAIAAAVAMTTAWKAVATEPDKELAYLGLANAATGVHRSISISYLLQGKRVYKSEVEANHPHIKATKKYRKDALLTVEGMGEIVVNRVKLNDELELVNLSPYQYTEADQKELTEHYAQIMEIHTPVKRKTWLVFVAVATFVLISIIPIKQRVINTAIAEGEGAFIVTAQVEGYVTSINANNGEMVTRGTVISEIRADKADNALIEAQLELEALEAKYEAQNIQSTENILVLSAEIDTAEQKIKYLSAEAQKKSVIASSDGLIQWNDAILPGAFVTSGQALVTIQQPELSLLVATIPTTEWINSKAGDEINYVSIDRDNVVINGQIESIEPILVDNNGVSEYTVRIRLDQQIRFGEKGDLVIKGQDRLLIQWLLRKPIAFVISQFPQVFAK